MISASIGFSAVKQGLRPRPLLLGPASKQGGPDADEIKGPAYGLIDEIGDGPGPVVEAGRWRHDHRPHLRRLEHQPQMSLMKRGFPNQKDEFPVLLEGNIGGADEEIVVIRMGNAREGLDGTGGDDHSHGFEGAAGDGGPEVGGVMDRPGEGMDAACGVVCLEGEDLFCGLRYDQVGFDFRLPEGLKQPHPVNCPACPGDAYDKPSGHNSKSSITRSSIPDGNCESFEEKSFLFCDSSFIVCKRKGKESSKKWGQIFTLINIKVAIISFPIPGRRQLLPV